MPDWIHTLIVSASVSVLTWALATWQQGKSFERQAAAQREQLDRQEKHRVLRERYEQRCTMFEEYLRVWQETYRGAVEVDDRNARRASWQPLRARLMFAFLDENIATQALDVLTLTEEVNRAIKSERSPEGISVADWNRDTKTVQALMLKSVNALATELGYPTVTFAPETDKQIKALVAAEKRTEAQPTKAE